jgi:hypothetical protein
MKAALATVFIVALFAMAYSCESWKYKECRKVGHSTLYCVSKIGSDQ